MNTPSSHSPGQRPNASPQLPPGGIAIQKAVNPSKLLQELHTQLGLTGTIGKLGTSFVLTPKTRPAAATDARIQAVIAQHTTTPAQDALATQLHHWTQLTPAAKDELMLAALKKLYGVK